MKWTKQVSYEVRIRRSYSNSSKMVSSSSLLEEYLQLSMHLIKINVYGGRDERIIVITNHRILLLNQSSKIYESSPQKYEEKCP